MAVRHANRYTKQVVNSQLRTFIYLLNFSTIVAILMPCGMLRKLSNVAVTVTTALSYRYQYTLLCIACGLECVLACQANLSLHYTAIYEPIFELHEPEQID